MKNVTLTAGNDSFRDAATEPDALGAQRVAAPRSGLLFEDPDGTQIDSIIIALLADVMRAKHVENAGRVMDRVGPLDREELYWTACETELPPAKGRSTITEPETSGRIVVAEDDAATRMLLVRVLTRAGFTVHACENGQQACDAVRRNGADVVLLDWMMPVMDGPTAVAHLKANLDTRGIPVVMLTAHSEFDEGVVALKTGVQDFLTKPFDPRDLVARIEQQLRWRTKPAVDANRAFTGERLGPYRPAETDVARRIDVTPVPSFFDRIWGKSPKPWALGRAA